MTSSRVPLSQTGGCRSMGWAYLKVKDNVITVYETHAASIFRHQCRNCITYFVSISIIQVKKNKKVISLSKPKRCHQRLTWFWCRRCCIRCWWRRQAVPTTTVSTLTDVGGMYNHVLVLSSVFVPQHVHALFIHVPRKSDVDSRCDSDYMEETCDPNGTTIDLSKETWLYGWIQLVQSGG